MRCKPSNRAAVIAAIAAVAAAACAKAPSDVLTLVSADATVPPILIMRVTVSSAAGQTSGELHSIAIGDATDRPAPFVFPRYQPVSADPSFAGPVTITIDGLDWDTKAVIATGTTTGELVPEHETQAALTLTAASSPGGADGGTADDAAAGVDGSGGG